MRTQPKTEQKDIRTILTTQVLPWWEQYGMSRLVASANTLKEFNAQPLPSAIQVSVKRRRGRKIAVRGPRPYNNTSYKIAVWPEDGQETIRYPALACVLRGQADFHIADYMVHCPPGHFMLFRENVPQPVDKPHFDGSDFSNRYCEVLWLMPQPGTTHHLLAWVCYSQETKHTIRWLSDYCIVERPEKMTFFNSFFQEAPGHTSTSRKLAEISLHGFLLMFARELGEGHSSASPLPETNVQRLPLDSANPIEMAKRYIQHHYSDDLTTQSVADAVYMSRSNFVRRFQQEAGQTFNQYLTAQRLQEAQRLLRESTRSITVIARLVGVSPSQLRHLFLKYHGVSPSAFALSSKKSN